MTVSCHPSFQLVCLILISFLGCRRSGHLTLQNGMIIEHSAVVHPDTLRVNLADSNATAITINGHHLVVDFQGATVDGRQNRTRPDRFTGTGITIKGSNITLLNARVHGFKIAILAEEVDSLTLINCDLSYNFRQRLGSTREKEDLNDWLYYHHNEADEWKRYGAAIYLKNCSNTIIRDILVTQGQNGIMMTGCTNALIYNNTIIYNSGIGIGLYRSSVNRIMHNQLNFNVRGYSHGIYQRGQDSAGLLAYEQSNNNIFAYNSATHSGDGFFLWAGQHTMDSGEGGCNGNIIYGNDFSFAPTNGIEVTFSSNYLVNNKMRECRYGIWGGYSFNTFIKGNLMEDCQFGLAIEHGNQNQIIDNTISNTETGVKLWAREKQPEDWGFARNRDVTSRQYLLAGNDFINVEKAFDITGTTDVIRSGNRINGTLESESAFDIMPIPDWPSPLADGREIIGKDEEHAGRKFIFVNEWGPYNFEYPFIWLRQVDQNKYIFVLLGPGGNWKITGAENFTDGSLKSGTFPVTLTAMRINPEESAEIQFEFIGEKFTDQFGQLNAKGSPYIFKFSELNAKII